MNASDLLRQISAPPSEIVLVRIDPDPAQVDRIRAKVEAAKAALGDKYLCHQSNRIQRKTA
jgi:hypothetical protein